MARKTRASKKLYGGGSGISVGAEQYGVFGPGNVAGAKADFEAMARDAADSMIAYPAEIFPKDLVGQKGGAKNMDVSGNSAEALKVVQDLMKGAGRRTRKGRGKAARKTVRGGKRKLSKALSEWNRSVMKVYRELKSKNKNTKLRDAMKEAKRRKDKGQL